MTIILMTKHDIHNSLLTGTAPAVQVRGAPRGEPADGSAVPEEQGSEGGGDAVLNCLEL